MSEKRYFWLRLQKDFFKRHDIRVIEAMPNGKDYILFYLKLLVESVSHEGRLRFSDTIPYNEDMLATVTNTNVDIVRSALKIFVELGMIEMLDDATIYMSEVEKMIGFETKWAEKKRLYRATHPKLSDKKDNVLDVSSERPPDVRQEIELELEKELELDKELDLKEKVVGKPTTTKEKRKRKPKEYVTTDEVYFPDDPKLNEALCNYIAMRETKDPMTRQALNGLLHRLEKLSGGDNEKATDLLYLAAEKKWLSVYVPEERYKKEDAAEKQRKEFERLYDYYIQEEQQDNKGEGH